MKFVFYTILIVQVLTIVLSLRTKIKEKINPQLVTKFLVTNDNGLDKYLSNIIWVGHKDAIGRASSGDNIRQMKFILSIRETGGLSVNRIKDGARAKPHTILEKSIKKSSMEKFYGDKWKIKTQDFYDTLKGFAGHYSDKGELLGLRADNPDKDLLDRNIVQDCPGENCAYVKKEDAIKLLKENKKKWTQHFYTGDYDIHEIYDSSNKIVPEASETKLIILNAINKSICDLGDFGLGQARCGEFRIQKTIHMNHEKPHFWAMIQHGDQATYKMNQHLEQGAFGPNPKVSPHNVQYVEGVNSESREALAWCVYGTWYVTKNLEEHREFRQKLGLIAPHHWGLTTVDKMGNVLKKKIHQSIKAALPPEARGGKPKKAK